MANPNQGTDHFTQDEAGGITPLGLFMGLTCLILGGVAVDYSNLIAVRTQLQVAADAAAHASIYVREFNDSETAKAKAIELVEASFPPGKYGTLLTVDDITFGSYDTATGTFVASDVAPEGVRVFTDRMNKRSNPVYSYLFKLVGMESFDVAAASYFSGAVHPCLRDGWVGEDIVDAQSNNDFYDGFCIHSNEHVEFNQNNFFQDGVTISMPDLNDLVIPASGFAHNQGLEQALRAGTINVRILDRMQEIFENIGDPYSKFHRDYLTSTTPISLSGSSFVTEDFTLGRVHHISCGSLASLDVEGPKFDFADPDVIAALTDVQFAAGGNGNGNGGGGNGNGNGGSGNGGGGGNGGGTKITIDASGNPLRNVVIYTDCEIQFSNNSVLESAVVYSTNTADKSITASQGLVLGADDDCAPEGSVQIMTMGGFEVAAKLEIYSSQVIALGPIQFAAQGDGVEGGNFISGSTIDGTSNTQMSACPAEGMEENFSLYSFRMAG